jgi:hypothetical protein
MKDPRIWPVGFPPTANGRRWFPPVTTVGAGRFLSFGYLNWRIKTIMNRFFTFLTIIFFLFLAACTQETQLPDDGVMTAVPSLTPTITQITTAVPTTPQPTNTSVSMPTPQNLPAVLPESTKSEADMIAIKTTPTMFPAATPAPTKTPLSSQSWPTLFSQEYGLSLHYPPGWTPVTTLPNRVSLVREGTSIALRFQVKCLTEDVNLVRSGVAAGSFLPRDPVIFLGQPISSDILVYQGKDKAVFYEKAAEITRGDLAFAITLESNRLDYEAVMIPQDVQAEADAIVASVEWITTHTPPLTGTIDLTLLYHQGGRLFQFGMSSQLTTPFALPNQGDVRDALLSRDGRYLAFADNAGLYLYDLVDGTSQPWLPGFTDPWRVFLPRAWNNADYLLVQHIWGTESSAPGWTKIGDDTWHPLPLPEGSTAEFYGLDSGAVWSPDGSQLALGGYDYGIPSSVPGLTIINLAAGTAQRIVTSMISSGIDGGGPLVAGAYDMAWSPDGQWIAFSLDGDAVEALNFPARLYRVRPDGTDLTPLTNNADGRATDPIWTAVDNMIYSVTGSSDTVDGIYTYDLSAQTHSLLIPGSDLEPITISDDGIILVYRQTRREGGFIYQDLMIWSMETGQSILVAAGPDGDPARFVGWLPTD